MKTPSFRTAMTSSVMALVIAFYPATAIVNADTTTVSPTVPQPTTTTQPTGTEAASTTEQPTAPDTTPTPIPSTVTSPSPAPAVTSTSAPEASVAPTQQSVPTIPQTATSTTESAATQPASPGSGYTYNPTTGLWENAQYTWDPNTRLTTPKNAASHSYNPSTGAWDTTDWRYDPSTGKYVPNTSAASPPLSNPTTPSNAPNASTPNNSASTPSSAPTSTFDNFYDASISGTINATSKSGDASVTQNTTASNVTTGDATAITNLFNLFQSSANFLNPGNELKTFTANIQGDVVGDLLLDPGQINSLASANGSTPMGSLTVNDQTNAAINAKINLDAASGNATVASNTKVGDTTTGNADAIANVVNMINSTIGAGQSFMGAINIHGNLDGDILLPPGFLDTLLASNSQSSTPANSTSDTSTLASMTNNQSITNKINANAQSGNATATDNTKVGDVASGNALTNLTVLNLTGSDVIGANNLLVFVNVLGKWYGVIMDAPAGTTAASLGGGITQNKSLTQAQDTTTRSESNSVINNDINVRARSGDALVTKNTTAGNATTGNATASVNLANVIGNHLSLSDWFGVLFINVFGTWKGSFGIDTVAGGITNPNHSTPSGGQQNEQPTQPRVFKFVPNGTGSGSGSKTASSAPYHLEPIFTGDMEMDQTEQSETDNVPTVLTSTVLAKGEPKTIFKPTPSEDKKQMASWVMPVAGLTLGSLLILGERTIALRRKEQ